MKGKILIIGNSIEIKLLRDALKERGLEVFFHSKEEFNSAGEGIDVIVYEIASSEMKNSGIVKKLSEKGFPAVIFLAEEPDLEAGIELIKAGAYDVKLLSTPLEILEKTVLYALEEKRIFWEEEEFLTRDPRMLQILKMLEDVARTKVPILLVGESGTGKELLAKFIHKKSPRKNAPFVGINCAALPETLLESELFGYEKGAFSGATFRKKGKIELADGGTLLLDEITEMHPSLQSKLLRVLQEGEVDRLGGYHPVKVDIRLISTTNRDIEKEVKEGRFRLDLYYRINVITVKIPPLRERKEDVRFLTKYFVEKFSRAYGKRVKGLTERAWEFLESYSFPGNVRELKNMVERGVLTCEGEYIDVRHLTNPFEFSESAIKVPETLEERAEAGIEIDKISVEEKKEEKLEVKPLSELEKEAILRALKVCRGNRTKAAELLGITVRTLRNKLKQYREEGLVFDI
jgi:two-component system response regulator FlrC